MSQEREHFHSKQTSLEKEIASLKVYFLKN
jgi:hypothetical protein